MKKIILLLGLVSFISCSSSQRDSMSESEIKSCGPQTPRDIGDYYGENKMSFPLAKDYKKLNLCNIHFHKNAENKGPGFSVSKGEDKHGGYACNQKVDYTKKEFMPFGKGACKNIEAGDTIEVHWVHSSCDIKPGPTLGSCLSKTCTSPKLRVETQVFLLVNDRSASSFGNYTKLVKKIGFHQAKKLPSREGAVNFLGSTTGPSYNNKCSPFKVNWSVSPKCQTLDIATVHKWCEKNVFNEDHAHGIRKLVRDPRLLSPIK